MIPVYHLEQGNKVSFLYKFISVKEGIPKSGTLWLKTQVEFFTWVMASCSFFCPGSLSINQESLVGFTASVQGKMWKPVITWPPIRGVILMLSRHPPGYPWWRSELKEIFGEDRLLASAKWINSSPVPSTKLPFPNEESWPRRRNSSDRETVSPKMRESLLQIKSDPFHYPRGIFDLPQY